MNVTFSEALLIERKSTHGDWMIQSEIHDNIIKSLSISSNYDGISASKKMALHAIAMKMARIVCGDPNHKDHWLDIAGYAHLGLGSTGENE